MNAAIKKVVDIALAEVGYVEKATGDVDLLYNNTANKGTSNYTKYGYEMHKVYPAVMNYPAAWCDCFVDWCFYKAFGTTNAKSLLGGNFDDYTPASVNLYKKKGAYFTSKPMIGDQIFFKNEKGVCHTGIVYDVDNNYVYTVEGNSSNMVAKRKYALNNSTIHGYGRPPYDKVFGQQGSSGSIIPDCASGSPALKNGSYGQEVTLLQLDLNYVIKAGLEVDGSFGPATTQAVKTFQSLYALNPDGIYGPASESKMHALLTGTANKPANNTNSNTSNAKLIWDFLAGKGLNAFAIAGIMGNIYAESGLASNNLQNTFEKKLAMNDAQYTAAVDSGRYTNFAKDSAGYGLCQWTYWTRKQALLEFAKKSGVSIGDRTMQLNFLWQEMTKSYSKMMEKLKNCTSVREAAVAFLLDFERPASKDTAATQNKRTEYSQKYYDEFANKTVEATTAVKFKVGDTVRLNAGALTYDGKKLASFVYTRDHQVKRIDGDRVVIAFTGITVAAVKDTDLVLIKSA